jgi:hypothetical protein
MRRSNRWFVASFLSPANLRGHLFSALACLSLGFSAFTPAARGQTTSTIEGSVNDKIGIEPGP